MAKGLPEDIEGAAGGGGVAAKIKAASASRAVESFKKDLAEVAKPSGSRMTGFGQKAGQLAPYIAKEADLHEAATGYSVQTYQDLSAVLGKVAEKSKGEYIGYAAQELKREVDRAATEQYREYQKAGQHGSPIVGGITNIHHPHPVLLLRLRRLRRPPLAEENIPAMMEKVKQSAGQSPWPSQAQLDKVQVLLKANPKNLNEGTVRWAIRHSLAIPSKVMGRFPDLATDYPNSIRSAP